MAGCRCLICLVWPQNVKDRDKAMMEMKRELKKLQVRTAALAPCRCSWLSQTRHPFSSQTRLAPLCRQSMRCDSKIVSHAQRIREQIRTWANDATIRDTSLLIEARRAIEHQMVRASLSSHLCLS